MWYHVEEVHSGEVGPGSTIWYHCERLTYVAYPQVHSCHVGQLYTPVGLVIDLDLRDTIRYE
jgi:hypothetical protein